jgi:hypothetical protein
MPALHTVVVHSTKYSKQDVMNRSSDQTELFIFMVCRRRYSGGYRLIWLLPPLLLLGNRLLRSSQVAYNLSALESILSSFFKYLWCNETALFAFFSD